MKAILFFSLLLTSSVGFSQTDSTRIAEVRAVIEQLFEGMHAGDSTLVREVFHTDAKAYTSFKKENAFQLHEGSVDEFVEAVGTTHDEVWNERISNLVIQVDDGLAHAWMDYSFYLDEEFSHQGINSVVLAEVDGRWQIIHIADTRRR